MRLKFSKAGFDAAAGEDDGAGGAFGADFAAVEADDFPCGGSVEDFGDDSK
jgi:hypothetical protein